MPTSASFQDTPHGKYSSWVGAIYIFNLIVGTGALTIPATFGRAGWLTGTVVMTLLAFMSYVTATYTIEAMAAANSLIHWRKLRESLVSIQQSLGHDEADDTVASSDGPPSDDHHGVEDDEEVRLLDSGDVSGAVTVANADFYRIEKQVEMGQMAAMFFNKIGLVSFYVIICVYLYGDLTIYGAAMSKTMRDVTCTYFSSEEMCNTTTTDLGDVQCWPGIFISRNEAYRIYVAVFLLVLGPFAFFNVQKTKGLQIATSILRWLAFGIMVVLAVVHLVRGKNVGQPPVVSLDGLPNLIGVCIYSFMCHHSLPSLVTPIADKSRIHLVMAADYASILTFYLLVALTGVFGFHALRDLYTLNFEPDPCGATSGDLPTDSVFVQYFLSLFPVFTLGTNFPIIAITLRNNFRQLFAIIRPQIRPTAIQKAVFPLLAVVPPMSVALATENIQVLVGLTGAFAGLGVQYVIPTALLVTSQQACRSALGDGTKNPHRSPFGRRSWIGFAALWTVACFLFILTDYIINGL